MEAFGLDSNKENLRKNKIQSKKRCNRSRIKFGRDLLKPNNRKKNRKHDVEIGGKYVKRNERRQKFNFRQN